MFQVNIQSALLIYLGAILTFFFGTWLYHHLRTKKKKVLSSSRQLAVCEYCQFAYLGDPLKKVNRCPSCTLLNKNNWYKT